MTMFELLRRRPMATTTAAVAVASAAILWLVPSPASGAAVAGLVLVATIALPAMALRGWWRLAGGLAGAAGFAVVLGVGVKLRYGGGALYPDTRTRPVLAEAALESLVALEYPPGNVAVAPDGRIFFNYHPFARAGRFGSPTVFELVDGAPRPFPDSAFQSRYQGTFGMTVDRQNRLWVTEPAALDHERTRVLAFDLGSGTLAFEHRFPPGQARFAQDLRVSPDGATVYLADTGLFEFTPASLIVLDVATRQHRQLLDTHASTQPQGWVIGTRNGPHRLAFGLLTFVVGVDGLELSPDGAWLYYAAMSHDTLYKVPTAALRDPRLSPDGLARHIGIVGKKPLSDGITVDRDGNVLVTDVEHGAVARVDPAGRLTTLVASPRVIWADGIVVAPDGAVLLTDSAIPAYIDQLARPPARERLAAAAPYHIYRVRMAAGRPAVMMH
jgi:sugar lactone lactonase YvrE